MMAVLLVCVIYRQSVGEGEELWYMFVVGVNVNP
jgi:hypothetical protein